MRSLSRLLRRAARTAASLTAAALLLLSSLDAAAWGREGHRTIALIAQKHLSNKAAAQIKELLGDKSIADVASWADEVRNQPEYKGTGAWHFVNLPLGYGFGEFNQQLKAKTEANAYQAFNDNLKLLADKTQPREKRLDALKFVVHLVGDIHEPMHVSRAEDKGGNDIQLQFQGEGTNLHRMWDSGLIHAQGLSDDKMAADYDHPDKQLAAIWAKSPVEQWLFESYLVSTKQYAEAPNGTTLDAEYYKKHIDEVRVRLQQGGIRLAEVLNEALK
ncbi:S1/P1 nuclease [Hymenobacter jeollabukensis]|uniref:S1/P1 nuclease n=1 Tax=Hymenobacter jeollabukensis TaxID=2025313 RepID=A0A5R8WPN4_9BACT|nr:S1/P1 nuclease [Hymenobacter jeollabukensis]TLM91830.1 S1/P1 nuclease [Hymenobacter jeollabukensis]